MKQGTLKKKAGQTGSSDSHPFLRVEHLGFRVSPGEKQRIEEQSAACGFGTVAHYVREQALTMGNARNPTEQHKALMACAYQFNKLGNNINQIARHLNQGEPFTEEAHMSLLQIVEHASELVKEARSRSGVPS